MTYIYLDYNGSAPLRPEAYNAMKPLLEEAGAAHNASAIHYFGREGRKLVEEARIFIGALVGAPPNQVIFNSGATEGNNTVLRHFAEKYPDELILVSATEHPSVLEGIPHSKNVQIMPVDEDGLVDLKGLDVLLDQNKVSLVSVMMVNNESGVVQNIAAISELAHKHGALMHSDVTQAAGRMVVDIALLGADFMTLSSHKIGGPQGVGALVLGLCGQTPTLLFGGGQEKSARAGTENVVGIVGFGAAAKVALKDLDKFKKLEILRDDLEKRVKRVSPDIVVHGTAVDRVTNTSFFSIPGANAQSVLMSFDLEKIAISNGSACSSGTVKPSISLLAMGFDEKTASSALRISMGWATKESDIDAFVSAWEKIYKRLKL
ncbi:MAG: aminotransferase class V-fold PLP-dependent enzyme [Alphaproteobacteria bacterium]|nr:aminotransferase class V-fold PLP-dependent enzyme [Alphaproteobacteria bacterium]